MLLVVEVVLLFVGTPFKTPPPLLPESSGVVRGVSVAPVKTDVAAALVDVEISVVVEGISVDIVVVDDRGSVLDSVL